MTNKEFFELSDKKVTELNGNNSEEAREAWRNGFIYAKNFVKKCLNTYYMDECIEKLEEFSNDELEEFKFNVNFE